MSEVKLYQGDCFELLSNIPDYSIDLICTDIPYIISQENHISKMPDRKGRNGLDFGSWDKEFDVSKLSVLSQKLRKGGSLICFHSFEQYSDLKQALCDLECKDRLIWEKTNPMPRNADRRYVCNAEMFTWYVKPGASWVFHCISDTYDGCVHKYPSESGGGFKRYHPCQKPQALLLNIIRRHSNVGDTVFDPFMGSGSIGVAAKTLDRHFIGIELDEKYFEIAKQRIEGVVPIHSTAPNKGSKSKRLF